MTKDSQSSPETNSLMDLVLAWPRTSLGRWSLGLIAGFVVLIGLFFVMLSLYGGLDEVRRMSIQAGGRFFSLPWLALTLVAASVSAAAALGAALVAIIRKRERSIAILLPLLIGGLVTLFSIGEMFFEGK